MSLTSTRCTSVYRCVSVCETDTRTVLRSPALPPTLPPGSPSLPYRSPHTLAASRLGRVRLSVRCGVEWQALIALTNFTIILAFRKEIRRRKALNVMRQTAAARASKPDRQSGAMRAKGAETVLRPEVIRPAAPPQLQRKR
jgi:hypothetical protein